MTSHESVAPEPYDRNKEIMERARQQVKTNALRRLHYLGLDPVGHPEIFPAEAIDDFIEEHLDNQPPNIPSGQN